MQKCPYNNSVECDKAHRDAERRRQMAVALQCGAFWIRSSDAACPAQPWQCSRINILPQSARQR